MTIAGSIEYIELANRHRKKTFGMFSLEEEREFFTRAGIVMHDLGI